MRSQTLCSAQHAAGVVKVKSKRVVLRRFAMSASVRRQVPSPASSVLRRSQISAYKFPSPSNLRCLKPQACPRKQTGRRVPSLGAKRSGKVAAMWEWEACHVVQRMPSKIWYRVKHSHPLGDVGVRKQEFSPRFDRGTVGRGALRRCGAHSQASWNCWY